MKKEQLELMEKWQVTMALMGIDLDNIYEDWDGDCFSELLCDHERHLERIAYPTDTMKAVLMTTELGVSSDEIDEYLEHLEDLRLKQEKIDRQIRIEQNPVLRSLIDDYDFKFINSKQYPKHRHFTFKNKTGLEIRGRVFNHRWGAVRVWLYWKDGNRTQQSRVYNYTGQYDEIRYPTGFPEDWSANSYAGYTIDPTQVSHIIAYRIIERKMPKNFTYPKK